MKFVLESTMICSSCKKQDQENNLLSSGDNAEKMAKIVERGLVEKHIGEHPECIIDLEISTTSRIINPEANGVIREVESGLNIESILIDFEDPESQSLTEEFIEDSSEFVGPRPEAVGWVEDF
jgi:hypothetical protein